MPALQSCACLLIKICSTSKVACCCLGFFCSAGLCFSMCTGLKRWSEPRQPLGPQCSSFPREWWPCGIFTTPGRDGPWCAVTSAEHCQAKEQSSKDAGRRPSTVLPAKLCDHLYSSCWWWLCKPNIQASSSCACNADRGKCKAELLSLAWCQQTMGSCTLCCWGFRGPETPWR